MRANGGEDSFEHIGCEDAGVGIVAGAMVAIEQCDAVCKGVRGAVTKRMGAAFLAEGREYAFVSDAPECDDGADLG